MSDEINPCSPLQIFLDEFEITEEIAHKFAEVTGLSPEFWLGLQKDYDKDKEKTLTDWDRLKNMTEEEIEENAKSDPDNPLLPDDDLKKFIKQKMENSDLKKISGLIYDSVNPFELNKRLLPFFDQLHELSAGKLPCSVLEKNKDFYRKKMAKKAVKFLLKFYADYIFCCCGKPFEQLSNKEGEIQWATTLIEINFNSIEFLYFLNEILIELQK